MSDIKHLEAIEWDGSAYHRKFGDTICLTQIGNEERPQWRWIKHIGDDGEVYDKSTVMIGWAALESKGGKKTSQLQPLVRFFYAPIRAGIYGSTKDEKESYIVIRRHIKSYKVGLSTNCYNILRINKQGEVGAMLDLKYINMEDYRAEVPLISKGNDFEIYDKIVGFVDPTRNKVLFDCSLLASKIKKDFPLPWQIESL